MMIKTCIQCAGREVEPVEGGTCPYCGGCDFLEPSVEDDDVEVDTSAETPQAKAKKGKK